MEKYTNNRIETMKYIKDYLIKEHNNCLILSKKTMGVFLKQTDFINNIFKYKSTNTKINQIIINNDNNDNIFVLRGNIVSNSYNYNGLAESPRFLSVG